jgi:hypothetical protein
MAFLMLSKYQRAFLPYLNENLVNITDSAPKKKSLTNILAKRIKKEFSLFIPNRQAFQ